MMEMFAVSEAAGTAGLQVVSARLCNSDFSVSDSKIRDGNGVGPTLPLGF